MFIVFLLIYIEGGRILYYKKLYDCTKVKRFLLVFFVVMMITSCFSESVQAYENTSTQDGIQVKLTTDKETYTNDQKINAMISVKNDNSFAIKNVSIKSIIPDGMVLADATEKSSKEFTLDAGKTYKVNTVLQLKGKSAVSSTGKNNKGGGSAAIKTKNNNGTASSVNNNKNKFNLLPVTGDLSWVVISIIFIIIIVSLLIIYRYKKHLKKIVSISLCVCFVSSMFNIVNVKANESEKSHINVSREIKVDKKLYALKVVVSYDTIAKDSRIIKINTSDFEYDNKKEQYFLFKEINKITGTLKKVGEISKCEYTISTSNNKIIKKGTFKPQDNWEISDFGLLPGINTINVKATNKKGQVYIDTISVYNMKKENMNKLKIDMTTDSDKDGLIDYVEDIYGTDKNKPDTDGDGLTDYQEVAKLGTNPLKKDTDGNGVLDGDEDHDGDGLKDAYELKKGYNPLSKDSDNDGLIDDEEEKRSTNALKSDTDGDGLSDSEEINLGTNPLVPDSPDKGVSKKFTNKDFGLGYNPVSLDIDLNAPLGKISSFKVDTVKDNSLLDETVPGYIGDAYDFSIDGKFNSAEIKMNFDKKLLDNKNFKPSIYYLNEKTQLLELVPSQKVEGNAVKANLQHFSKYILLNQNEYESVWKNEIRKPDEKKKSMDVVFTLDISKSMDWNDPKGLRKTLTNKFIDMLDENDRAGAVVFRGMADGLNNGELAKTKEEKGKLKKEVESIENDDGNDFLYSGTNGSLGLYTSMKMFQDDPDKYKSILFLTDGGDTVHSYDYSEIIRMAMKRKLIFIL